MHHVTRFDPSMMSLPWSYERHSEGYRRASHVWRGVGAVHTDFGTSELGPGGSIDSHVHSYEEFFYVVEGNPQLTLDGRTYQLAADECGFVGVGMSHAWRNLASERCRWIDFRTPQARSETEPPDTFFVPDEISRPGEPLDVRDPRTQRFARWHHGQMNLDLLKRPAPADAPDVSASMSSALLAYTGITVKMLVDERHGAHLGNMFMVDYHPDAVLLPHDHPIEEAFYMLEGEVEFVADGRPYTLRTGDVAFAGVGCIHAFENRSGARCRWLETRAPLPPLHHAYRFERDWEYLSEQLRQSKEAGVGSTPGS
jgi:quercetin dioxygenase-like cupin family protein